jgi:hypothetical protein
VRDGAAQGGGAFSGLSTFFVTEAAGHVRHVCQPHVLQRLGGKRRAQTAGAEQHQLLARREQRLVIRALRVDPEFEHAARRVIRTRDDTIALEFAHVADVYELHVVAAVQFTRLGDAVGGDRGVGLVDHVDDGTDHGGS